jgi:thiol-disulfide isomerase/thioredoxin
MKFIFILALAFVFVSPLFGQNEQSPIVAKEIKYADWTYPVVGDVEKESELRKLSEGRKLVVVVYFAAWCPNWRHDAPALEAFYKKYHDQGLEIVGVSEYEAVDKVKTNLASLGVTFPVVYESLSRAQRESTTHYQYRKQTGDKRTSGSPWYILLDPSKFEANGEIVVKNADVINGEMIMSEGEAYIRKHLGLPAEKPTTEKASAAIEPCDTEKAASLKKH